MQSCSSDPERNPKQWARVMQGHIERYPDMGIQDMYKLIYQATYGPAHLGIDQSRIAHYLKTELATVAPDSDESLVESISPSDRYIRINLKKFKTLGINKDILIEAVFRSCQPEPEGKAALQARMDIFHYLIREGRLPYTEEEFFSFRREIAAQGYPVVHHTKAYVQRYNPAYRVVNQSVWEDLRAQGLKHKTN